MAEFPALPLWTDAYLADTRHLTRDEHGAYLLLMMEAWRRPRCCLPDDDNLLARLTCSTPEEWAALKPTVMAFWAYDANACEWTQKRLKKEHQYIAQKRSKNRTSARKRWEKTKTSDANASESQSERNAPTPTPTPTKTQDQKSGQSGEADLLSMNGAGQKHSSPFKDWWKVYPRKANKGGAEKAFKAALKKASLGTLTTAARNYAESCRAEGTEEKYIAHAATWLNQERWEDWLKPQTQGNDYGPGYRVVAGTLIRDRSGNNG